jgi:hypothetical protein
MLIKSETLEKMKYMRSNLLEKDEYESKIKILYEKLNNNQISRDELDKSLGLLPVNDRTGKKVALTFDDRVKLFEDGMEERNKQAEDFVKKM